MTDRNGLSGLSSPNLYPSEIADKIRNRVQEADEQFAQSVIGIYHDRKAELHRNGFYYDELRDPHSQDTLRLWVPAGLKRQLEHGMAYAFRGLFETQVINKESKIEFAFRVSDVETIELPSVDELFYKRSHIVHLKLSRKYKRINVVILDKLRTGNPLFLNLIYDNDSAVQTVLRQLDSHSKYYRISWTPVDSKDKSVIIDALNELDDLRNSDLLGVVFESGDREIFDDVELGFTVSNLNIPFITAIGHVDDHNLCSQVADMDFGTPGAFGGFLRELAERSDEEQSWIQKLELWKNDLDRKADDIKNKEERLLKEKESLDDKQINLKHFQQEYSTLQQSYDEQCGINRSLSSDLGKERSKNRKQMIIGFSIGIILTLIAFKIFRYFSFSVYPTAIEQRQMKVTPTVVPTPKTPSKNLPKVK